MNPGLPSSSLSLYPLQLLHNGLAILLKMDHENSLSMMGPYILQLDQNSTNGATDWHVMEMLVSFSFHFELCLSCFRYFCTPLHLFAMSGSTSFESFQFIRHIQRGKGGAGWTRTRKGAAGAARRRRMGKSSKAVWTR